MAGLRDYDPLVILVSGKRKSGKDYFSNTVHKRLGSDLSTILHISDPLKREYAKVNNLNFDRLMDSSSYKEKYRFDMVEWGERKRKIDTTYFCRKAVETSLDNTVKIWIIADIRRFTDIYFFEQFKNLKVRITAEDKIREKRGWIFTKGIDDCETETNLDDYTNWDFVINNNDDGFQMEKEIERLCSRLKELIF